MTAPSVPACVMPTGMSIPASAAAAPKSGPPARPYTSGRSPVSAGKTEAALSSSPAAP